MSHQHTDLAQGRWFGLSFVEQMGNVGSEVERTIKWKQRGDRAYQDLAFDRAVELLDLTIADAKNRSRLKEIVRVREALADFFVFSNEYHTTDRLWENYFRGFAYAARIGK